MAIKTITFTKKSKIPGIKNIVLTRKIAPTPTKQRVPTNRYA
jgi:hypothetical protein